MADVVQAVLTATDRNYTSTIKKAMGVTDGFAKKVAGGIGFGALLRIGGKAIDTIGSGVKGLVSDIDSTNAAWKSFRSNMEMIGRGTEVDSVKKELQDFAAKTVYTSADMAQTYSQLAAVGTKNTSKLVQGFGMVAAAAENPQQAMKTLSTQATQMAAKPNVAWQDFKLMLEQTPAGISQVAKAMGMTTTELVQNVQDGTVATEDFFNAIIKAADAKELQEMAKQYKTIGQAADGVRATLVNRLAPSWEKINKVGIARLSQLMGAFGNINADALADSVGAAVDKVDAFLDKMIAKVQQAGGIGSVLKQAFAGIGVAALAVEVGTSGLLPSLSALGGVGKTVGKSLKSFGKDFAWWGKMAKAGATIFKNDLIAGFKETGAQLPQMLTGISSKFQAFSGVLGGVFGKLGGAISSGMNVLGVVMKAGLAALAPAVLFAGLLAGLGLLGTAFGDEINNVINVMKSKGPEIITNLGESITAQLPTLMSKGTEILTNLIDGIAANIPAIITQGTNIIITLVQGVMAAMPQLIPAAFNAIGQFLIGIATALPQLITTGLQLIASLVSGISQNLPQLMQSAMTALGQFIVGIIQNLPQILAAGGQILLSLCQGILNAITNIPAVISSVFSAIKGAITGNKAELETAGQDQGQTLTNSLAQSAQSNVSAVQSAGQQSGASFGVGLNSAISGIQIDTGRVTSALNVTAPAAQSSGTQAGSGFGVGLNAGIHSVVPDTSSVINGLQQAAPQAQSAGSQVGTQYAQGIRSAQGQIASASQSASNASTSALRNGYSKAYSAGAYISQGMAAGMWSAVGSIRAAAAAMSAAADEAMRAKAKVSSPSKVTKKTGKFIGEGLVVGLLSKVRAADKAGKIVVGNMLNTMKSAVKRANFESIGDKVGDKVANAVTKSVKNMDSAFTKAFKKIEKSYKKKIEKLGGSSSSQKKQKKALQAQQKTTVNTLKKLQTKLDKAYDNQIDKASEKIEKLGKTYQQKYDAIISQQNDFVKRLGTVDDLFEETIKKKNGVTKSTFIFADFNAEKKKVDALGNNIEKLKKILPRGLMDEIVSMDTADALNYTNQMLKMSTSQIEAYGKSYTDLQTSAAKVSKTFYSDRVQEVKNQYTAAVEKEFKALKKKLNAVGQQAVQGFADGMRKKTKKLDATTKALVNAVIKAAKKKLKIHSPSKVFENIGSYTGEGFVAGIDKTQRDVQSSINNMLQAADFNKQMADRRFSGNLSDEYDYNIAARYEIVVPLEVNGREFARATADDMSAVQAQRETYNNRKRGIR